MTRRPSDRVVVARALEHLRAGTLASALTERLTEEYSLTPERAKELASRAAVIHKKLGKLGKLDKKPFDELG